MVNRHVSCPVCAEVIGVYEPVLVPHFGTWRETSLAREPHLRHADVVLVHVGCSAELTAPADDGDTQR
jgi:C4-type Zn-finger protein